MGGRFCPPLQRWNLNFPRDYVPEPVTFLNQQCFASKYKINGELRNICSAEFETQWNRCVETSLAVTNVIFHWDLALCICLADGSVGSVIITGDPHFMQISLLQFYKTFLIFGLCIFGTNFISLLQFFDCFLPKNDIS